jgi:uncharacterized protein YqhQ
MIATLVVFVGIPVITLVVAFGMDNPRQAVKLVDTVFRILLVVGIIWLIVTRTR